MMKKVDHDNGTYTYIRQDETNGELKETIRNHQNLSDMNQMGYFGNIWVRSHYFAKAGDTNGGGHYHHFDHVTLLAVGSVLVEVGDEPPKEFHAPTFIVIPKDNKHKFTALTDGVVYYCVFALRDENGELTDMYTGDNSPYMLLPDKDWEAKNKIKKFDKKTTIEGDV
jgi:hypothetical protein